MNTMIFSCSGEDGRDGTKGQQGEQGHQGNPGTPGQPDTANVVASTWTNYNWNHTIPHCKSDGVHHS